MKFIDICSGIGGGHLGILRAFSNAKCIGFSEIDKGAINIYQKAFPDINNLGDVNDICIKELEDFDLLIAGFPCQSFSINGSREGFAGRQGFIVFKILEIIRLKKPKYILLENVKGLLSHRSGNTLKVILNTIQNSGYFYKHTVLNSKDFSLPQSRERLYIFASKSKSIVDQFEFPKCKNRVKYYDVLNGEKEASTSELETIRNRFGDKYNFHICKNSFLSSGEIIDYRQSDLRKYSGYFPTLRASKHGLLYFKSKKLFLLTGKEALILQGFPNNIIEICNNLISNNKILFYAGNAMSINVISNIFKILKCIIEKE
ncbi:MAG: DNA (cytosine-5-)-methyltransferase [Chlamydiia bacterium]|nr:DNA (cytosine-5-)-methyltransferase [Chlamydiia bacterium]